MEGLLTQRNDIMSFCFHCYKSILKYIRIMDGMYVCSGAEPLAEEAVQLIRDTGGIAVLAHPWALKNPVAVIRQLKEAGLHGLEVYRSDGKLAGN